jgi:upstream activation factor subunit UAF30
LIFTSVVAPQLVSLYTPIIDSILAGSDLETISAKRIRAALQDRVDHDIAANKEAITALIMQRFDLVATDDGPESAPVKLPPSSVVKPPPKATNGTKVTTLNGKRSSPGDGSPTAQPAKKHKTHTKGKPSIEDLDREYAARLQAEEMARARSTRGGGGRQTKKPVGKKDKDGKKKKKKSKAKVGSDDDSELESGAGAKKKDKPEREKKGGFHVRLRLPLAEAKANGLETNAVVSAACDSARRGQVVETANRQENLGAYQVP